MIAAFRAGITQAHVNFERFKHGAALKHNRPYCGDFLACGTRPRPAAGVGIAAADPGVQAGFLPRMLSHSQLSTSSTECNLLLFQYINPWQKIAQRALKLMETRRRSLLLRGTLWGNHPGKISMLPSCASKTISGVFMASVFPGKGRGLYSW